MQYMKLVRVVDDEETAEEFFDAKDTDYVLAEGEDGGLVVEEHESLKLAGNEVKCYTLVGDRVFEVEEIVVYTDGTSFYVLESDEEKFC